MARTAKEMRIDLIVKHIAQKVGPQVIKEMSIDMKEYEARVEATSKALDKLFHSSKDILDIQSRVKPMVKDLMIAEKEAEEQKKRLTKETKTLAKEQDTLSESFSKATKALVGFFALRKVTRFLEDTIELTTKQERATMRMVVGLTAGAKATSGQIDALEGYSKALERTTLFSDQQIQSMMGVLGQGRLTAEQIKRLTPLILDTATGMELVTGEGKNLEVIARAIVRGIDRGAGALTFYGIRVDEATRKQIKMADAGERLEIIMDLLERSYGGIAEIMGKTLSAQIAQTQKQWINLKETIGSVTLLMIGPAVQGFNALVTGFNDAQVAGLGFFDFLTELERLFLEIPRTMAKFSATTVRVIATMAKGLVEPFASILGIGEEFVREMNELIIDSEHYIDVINKEEDALNKLRAEQRAGMIVNTALLKQLADLETGLEEAAEATEEWEDAFEKAAKTVKDIREEIKGMYDEITEAVKEYHEKAMELEQEHWDSVVELVAESEMKIEELRETMLQKQKDYAQKRFEIEEKYNEKIGKIHEKEAEKIKEWEEEKAEIRERFGNWYIKKRDNMLKDIDEQIEEEKEKNKEAIEELAKDRDEDFGDLSTQRTKDLIDLSDQIAKKLEITEGYRDSELDLEDQLNEQREFLRKNDFDKLVATYEKKRVLAMRESREDLEKIRDKTTALIQSHQIAMALIGKEHSATVDAYIDESKTFKEMIEDKIEALDKWEGTYDDYLERMEGKGLPATIIPEIPTVPVTAQLPGAAEVIGRLHGTPAEKEAWLENFRRSLIPFQAGGPVSETGAYLLHKGETVVPATGKGVAGNTFIFHFEGAFIGDREDFERKVIDSINRESELRELGGK